MATLTVTGHVTQTGTLTATAFANHNLNLLYSTMVTNSGPVLQIAVLPAFCYTVCTSTNLVNWDVLTHFYATFPNAQLVDSAANLSSVRLNRAA